MSDALICPKCGTPYKRNQLSCMKCNYLLFDPKASTVHIRVDPGLLRLRRARELHQEEANTAERMIHLQIRGLIEKLAFEEETEIVLGRVDLANPDPGRFDLTPFGGHERGVSRAHALLRYADNQLTVTDLNSANGTTVNQKRILPNEPLVLHDGDQLMLGSLSIGVRLDPKPSLHKTGPLTLSNSPEPPNIYETPSRLPVGTPPKTEVPGEAAARPETTMPHRPANLPEMPPPDATNNQVKPAAIQGVRLPLSTMPVDPSMITADGRLIIPVPEPKVESAELPTSPAPSPSTTVPEEKTDTSTKPTTAVPPLPPKPPEVKPNADSSVVGKSST